MSDVLIDKRGPVLWLTINRPEQRNALNRDALHAVQDMSLPQCLDYMTLMLDRLSQTEDASEGFAAFASKRKRAWTGR